jgi:hypothetical protein
LFLSSFVKYLKSWLSDENMNEEQFITYAESYCRSCQSTNGQSNYKERCRDNLDGWSETSLSQVEGTFNPGDLYLTCSICEVFGMFKTAPVAEEIGKKLKELSN